MIFLPSLTTERPSTNRMMTLARSGRPLAQLRSMQEADENVQDEGQFYFHGASGFLARFSFAAVAGQNNGDVLGAPGITNFGWATAGTLSGRPSNRRLKSRVETLRRMTTI